MCARHWNGSAFQLTVALIKLQIKYDERKKYSYIINNMQVQLVQLVIFSLSPSCCINCSTLSVICFFSVYISLAVFSWYTRPQLGGNALKEFKGAGGITVVCLGIDQSSGTPHPSMLLYCHTSDTHSILCAVRFLLSLLLSSTNEFFFFVFQEISLPLQNTILTVNENHRKTLLFSSRLFGLVGQKDTNTRLDRHDLIHTFITPS